MSAEFRPPETLDGNEKDPLELKIATKGDIIEFQLGRRVSWFALPKAQAIEFAIVTLKHCGVHVDITHKIEGTGGG